MILFDAIRHQEGVITVLRGAAASGRLAHAYIFWGPEGVGKTRTAQALAQLLLCSRPDPPCGSCSECERVARLTHPDLHCVLPGARGGSADERKQLEAFAADFFYVPQIPRNATISIERIRGLKLESSKARVRAGNRVIVIRNAGRMTHEAAQAALKIIEEPQPGTFLILTCRDPSRVLPTILSRCQRMRLRALPREYIEGTLIERLGLEAEVARFFAALAQGGLGRALTLAESDARTARDRAIELFETPLGDAGEAARRAQALGRGWDAEAARMAGELLLTWYSDLLAVRHELPAERLTHGDRLPQLRRQAEQLSLAAIRRRIETVEEMLGALEQHVNPLLALQGALLRINGLVEADPPF